MGKFHRMTRFTITDFNKGYWMVELDPESRKYTMMALGQLEGFSGLDFQLFPLWHKMSFRGNWDAIFLSVPGVMGIADDMIIYGRSDLAH